MQDQLYGQSSVLSAGSLIPIIWIIGTVIVIVAVLFIILLILRKVFASHRLYPAIFEKKVFRLSVPPIDTDADDDGKHRQIKEMVASVENFYMAIGGMPAQKGFKTWLFGRFDSWAFEIVVGSDGLITFYMAIPAYLEQYIKQQLLSQYPHCQFEEVEDYNIFDKQGFAAAGHLKLAKSAMFPLLTFKQMENDPLLGVLSSLSKLGPGQTVAIQFMMRSARSGWRSEGVKLASAMQQGKSLKQALSANDPLAKVLGKPADWIGSSPSVQSAPKEAYRLSPLEEQMVKAIEEKAAKPGMDVNIRIVSFAPNESQAKEILRYVANSFSQYSNYQYGNSFKAVVKGSGHQLIHDFIYRRFDDKHFFVLNSEEMVSLWHLPFPDTEVPRIRWLQAKKLPPPVNMPTQGVAFGVNKYRGQETVVRIKDEDRRRHMYIVGMTGVGKSYLMALSAIQDIVAGKGVCVVDPHGGLIEDILPHIPKERLEDVIIFDPSDGERPIGLNMLEASSSYEMDMAAQEMIQIFYKLLPDPAMAGPMFEHYMRNALLALMADQDDPGTLVELARIFTDEGYRRKKLEHVKDILVKDFWEREYAASQKGSTGADMLSYVISKTGRFVENELMRNIIGQSKSGINFREVMDKGKILLMNLSKGRIGETNSSLLGLIAVSKLQMAALGRADMAESERKDFYLYIDEFQNFITDSISIILSEARKYKLNLIMGHQFIAQLVQNNDTRVRDAIFGNVGTVASYRIGVDDAETIAKQLGPKVSEYDVMNVEKYNIYLRLLIDNQASDAFNVAVYNFKEMFPANPNIVAPLKELSRLKHGRDRNIVVREIIERSKIGQLGAKPKSAFADF